MLSQNWNEQLLKISLIALIVPFALIKDIPVDIP